jgi:glutaredoxin-dependent peroxiredoxin
MALQVGDKAPAFKLFNTNKEEVSLESYKGKNLLVLFFPMAFTSVCTAELCGVRDDIANYSNTKSEVVGISVDSVFTLNKFKEDQRLPFALLSDFNKEVSKAYDAQYEEFAMGMKGVAKRAAFVIDKDGVIKYAEVLEKASDVPNFEAINKVLVGLN